MIDFQKIGKYEVTAKLGQGSFGVVYQGRDAYLKRDVAIKVCSVEDKGLRRRFLREAEIAGKLVHKNIVTVYEFGFEGEIPFLVQELLSGEDLNRMIKRRAQLAVETKLEILVQVANGLGYAHTEGVIHRDIKPGNIRVLDDGRIKIMDFGIAKLASAETQLTQKGVTMGTASYLPPEQIRGSDLDHRADIFSFGVLAHELMAYERPFRGNTLSALVYQILYKVPQPMTSTWDECPQALSDLVARCLEKKPDRRFASLDELLAVLTEFKNEVAAGKWPALTAAAVPESPEAPQVQEPSDVLAPGEITRTAKGVLEGKVGDYTISTVVPVEEAPRPQKTGRTERSTQPIEVRLAEALTSESSAAESSAPESPAPEASAAQSSTEESPSTRQVPAETLPDQESRLQPTPREPSVDDTSQPLAAGALETRIMPSLAEGMEMPPDLASTAHEISELVAQGQLEAAREQLDATINQQDLTLSTPDPATPPATEETETISHQATRPVQPGQEIADPAPAPSTLEQAALEADSSPPPLPETQPLVRPADATPSDTYRTFFRPPLGRLQWAGATVGLVLLATVAWLLLRGGDEEPPEPVVETPAPEVVVPTVAPEPAMGAVTINAVPWAEITEITDSDGYLKDLPEVTQTPLYLELPPGQYKIHLRFPDSEEIQTCDLDVQTDTVASCAPASGETRADDYFKETGWWQ